MPFLPNSEFIKFRTLSSWGSGNYRPSAPLLYEVASHVKQLPFGHYYYYYIEQGRQSFLLSPTRRSLQVKDAVTCKRQITPVFCVILKTRCCRRIVKLIHPNRQLLKHFVIYEMAWRTKKQKKSSVLQSCIATFFRLILTHWIMFSI